MRYLWNQLRRRGPERRLRSMRHLDACAVPGPTYPKTDTGGPKRKRPRQPIPVYLLSLQTEKPGPTTGRRAADADAAAADPRQQRQPARVTADGESAVSIAGCDTIRSNHYRSIISAGGWVGETITVVLDSSRS